MPPLLSLLAVLAALWLLGALLSRHIQGTALLVSGSPRVATATYDLLVLPGVVLHELSHVVFALLLGVRVLNVNLFQFRSQNDVRQGEVVVAKADPLRMSVIGAAPLFGGIGALALIVGLLDPPALSLDLAGFRELGPLLSGWSSALALYLLVAIANTMFPSAADRKAWWIVGAALLIIAALLLAFGVRPSLPPRWIALVNQEATRLTTALLPVALIDIACLVVIILAETLISRVRRRRVIYRI